MNCVRSLGVFLSIVVWSPRLLAQTAPTEPTADAKKEARAHFKQGRAFHDAGAFDKAIEEYLAAYKVMPLPELLFNVGQAYRQKGDKPNAIEYYRKYLGAEPEGLASDEAREHVATLLKQIQDEQAKAEEDKRRRAEEQALMKQRAEEDARLRATSPATQPRDTGRPPSRSMRIAGMASAGVGVVMIGLGVVEGQSAKSNSDMVSSAMMWSPALSQAYQDGDSANRNMYIFYGVGGAALVAGGLLYWYGLGSEPETKLGIAPLVGPQSAAVSVHGRF